MKRNMYIRECMQSVCVDSRSSKIEQERNGKKTLVIIAYIYTFTTTHKAQTCKYAIHLLYCATHHVHTCIHALQLRWYLVGASVGTMY